MGKRQFDIDFEEPRSVEEAILRKQLLGTEIERIQEQLGDRNRTVDGERLDDHEYWQWRKRALAARACKAEEIRRLKEYLVQHPERPRPNGRRQQAQEHRGLVWRCLRALLLDAPREEKEALARMLDACLRGPDDDDGEED